MRRSIKESAYKLQLICALCFSLNTIVAPNTVSILNFLSTTPDTLIDCGILGPNSQLNGLMG